MFNNLIFFLHENAENIFGLGYLEWLSGAITAGVNSTQGTGEVRLLQVITDPFVDLIIQVKQSY